MSWRRLVRKLSRKFRRAPQCARDVIPRYESYVRLQLRDYLSHEEEVERWKCGLERFVRVTFEPLPRHLRVLDCACGDGVGLSALRDLGFENVIGVELAPEKARRAAARGFRVEVRDMHSLEIFRDGEFGAVLSSHTLEHAWDPARVLAEFRRVLEPGGKLFVVLPYPDPGPRNERAHPAKYELGTARSDDDGGSVRRFFTERGFRVCDWRRDEEREPEIWLTLEKTESTTAFLPRRAPEE